MGVTVIMLTRTRSKASQRADMVEAKSRLVVVLATSTRTMGGISSVIRTYEHAGLFRKRPTIHITTHEDGTTFHKLLVAVRAFWKFSRMLILRRVLLVHVHSASNGSFWRKSAFMVLAFVARRPVIFHLHGGGFMDFYDQRCGPVRRWFIGFVLNRVAEIVVLTDEWAHRLSRITKNRNITVIVNPVPTHSLLSLGSAPRRNDVVLFLGRIEKAKGIFESVDAISMVRREFPGVKLWFAGEGERDALRSYIDKSGLGGTVEFFGWVSGELKTRLLREATLYILPSYLEGLPMGVLEAMAAGLPVVATRVGGIPSVVEDGLNGFLVRPGNASEVAKPVCTLLRDPALRARMGAISRTRISECFLPERVVPQIDYLYAKLIASHGGTQISEHGARAFTGTTKD